MEWILITALAVCAFALVAVFVLRNKRHGGESIPGHFDFSRFDHYKADENAKRGLFDKTKWR